LCEVSSSTTLYVASCIIERQLCDNSTGKARCICAEGWRGSRCQERINETQSIFPTRMPTFSRVSANCTGSSDCAIAGSDCIEGQCRCRTGFTPRKGSCININECEVGFANGCDSQAECIDNEGSYECRCNEGFSDANPTLPGRQCQQTNECITGSHDCDDATQVCLDRRPPEKWECIEQTPATTPTPNP
jgi:Calcium-binding EGF domain/EB module